MSLNNEADLALLARANNYLAVRLHSEFAKEGGNTFFSPFSISVALSMLLRGTRGDTAKELSQFLGFESVGLHSDKVHHAFEQLLQVLAEKNEFYTLAISNALAYHCKFEFHPEYKNDLQSMYQALALEVDFVEKNEDAVKQINDFVEECTRSMIPKIFDSLEPSTIMVLLNAVYFKGSWMHQFNKAHTTMLPFYNNGKENNKVEVPMMYISKRYPFAEKENFKALELPYEGEDVGMLLLLPDDMSKLDLLEQSLSSNFIEVLKEDMNETKVDVTIPKLHLEYSKELEPVCKKLGLKAVFQCGANFGGMSNSNQLKVSSVIHKAVLDVNEEGSEAAAVTAVTIRLCCLEINPNFKADHPYLFVIYDKRNNFIYFMGRVEEL